MLASAPAPIRLFGREPFGRGELCSVRANGTVGSMVYPPVEQYLHPHQAAFGDREPAYIRCGATFPTRVACQWRVGIAPALPKPSHSRIRAPGHWHEVCPDGLVIGAREGGPVKAKTFCGTLILLLVIYESAFGQVRGGAGGIGAASGGLGGPGVGVSGGGAPAIGSSVFAPSSSGSNPWSGFVSPALARPPRTHTFLVTLPRTPIRRSAVVRSALIERHRTHDHPMCGRARRYQEAMICTSVYRIACWATRTATVDDLGRKLAVKPSAPTCCLARAWYITIVISITTFTLLIGSLKSAARRTRTTCTRP